MLLHYKSDGDRLNIKGRVAGSNRCYRHHYRYGWLMAVWLEWAMWSERGLTGSQRVLKRLGTRGTLHRVRR